MDRFEIEFQPLGRRTDAAVGASVLDAARDAGVSIASDCGGRGTCGRCRIEVVTGKVLTIQRHIGTPASKLPLFRRSLLEHGISV